MSVAEAPVEVELLTEMHNRIHVLMDEGMTQEQATKRVVAEFKSFKKIVQSVHFAFSEAILRSRIATHDWNETMSADQVRKQFLPN